MRGRTPRPRQDTVAGPPPPSPEPCQDPFPSQTHKGQPWNRTAGLKTHTQPLPSAKRDTVTCGPPEAPSRHPGQSPLPAFWFTGQVSICTLMLSDTCLFPMSSRSGITLFCLFARACVCVCSSCFQGCPVAPWCSVHLSYLHRAPSVDVVPRL